MDQGINQKAGMSAKGNMQDDEMTCKTALCAISSCILKRHATPIVPMNLSRFGALHKGPFVKSQRCQRMCAQNPIQSAWLLFAREVDGVDGTLNVYKAVWNTVMLLLGT